MRAFVVSRTIYGTAYLRLTKGEVKKLNVLIRKAYKTALGVPSCTFSCGLLELGVHNTVEELWKAQKLAQMRRLNKTANGKWLLAQLGLIIPGGKPEPLEGLTPEMREKISVSPIPRHMHPVHNAERRRARAESLGRLWNNDQNTLYADAAGPQEGHMVAVVTTPDVRVLNSASMRTKVVTHGEQAAIALAIAYNPRAIIFTDSQEACRHFVQGSVSILAHEILRRHPPEKVFLIWAPKTHGTKGERGRQRHSPRSSHPGPLTPTPVFGHGDRNVHRIFNYIET